MQSQGQWQVWLTLCKQLDTMLEDIPASQGPAPLCHDSQMIQGGGQTLPLHTTQVWNEKINTTLTPRADTATMITESDT